uniref:Ribosomal protein S8 n=1 Tax=Guillardia theta TaxID=55529 RepID=A0A481WAV2_GUITH|nr:ribosomal protein S8 [Guillardia theta]QBJ06320.1 ribosomal protein S8 [Guillardia theta]
MSNPVLSNFLNMLKAHNQKKASVLKIRFSKKYIKVLDLLFKEGFIRGYFLAFEQNIRMIHVLLKYTSNANEPFSYKAIKFTEEHKYRAFSNNQTNDFNLVIVSTAKGLYLKKILQSIMLLGNQLSKCINFYDYSIK